jgi:hypothetical protein
MVDEQWAEAIKLIESQPLLFERNAELSWNLGWAYFKLEDWKAAQVHLGCGFFVVLGRVGRRRGST